MAKVASHVSNALLRKSQFSLPGTTRTLRWSSSKSANALQRRALVNLACRYAQAALMSEGIVLGSSFVPSPRHPALKETHPVF